ncbi:MAG: ribonuclease P protein component [Bdellovibrionota bacterium]
MSRKEGFPRICRMTERPQFVRLFDDPKVYRAQAFHAFWKPNGQEHPRLGITLKGKISSVWRAKLKRAIREWFRKNKDTLGKNDINIVVRSPQKLDIEFLDRLKRQLSSWSLKN